MVGFPNSESYLLYEYESLRTIWASHAERNSDVNIKVEAFEFDKGLSFYSN